jgi:phosphate starvation-inducible membrane PsiE
VDEVVDATEPTIQPPPTKVERHLNRVLERTASVLTSLVAMLLILFVAIALVGTVSAAAEPLVHEHDFMRAAIDGLDGAFLVVILLELVHTTLSRGPVSRQVQEFLVVGITSAVRSGLEVAANRGGGPAQPTAVSLAINASGVLILVAAFWLIRQRLHAERTQDASK